MADKLDVKRVSLSLVYATAIVSVVCALLLIVFPLGSMRLLGSIFHGLDISKIAVTVTFGINDSAEPLLKTRVFPDL